MADKNDVFWILVISGAVIAAALGIGSCIHDYMTSTPQITEVMVLDKRYVPGHYVNECSTDMVKIGDNEYPITSCQDVWYDPTWTIWFQDGPERRSLSVNVGMYDILQLGDHRFMSYYKGGYWAFAIVNNSC